MPIQKVKIRRSKWVFRSRGVCGKLRYWRRSFEINRFFLLLIFFIPVCAGVSCSCWPWRSSSWRRRRPVCELAAPTWRDSASSTADCTSAWRPGRRKDTQHTRTPWSRDQGWLTDGIEKNRIEAYSSNIGGNLPHCSNRKVQRKGKSCKLKGNKEIRIKYL